MSEGCGAIRGNWSCSFDKDHAGRHSWQGWMPQASPCLLPDDDTAVERLAPIVHQVFCVEVMEEDHQLVGPWDEGRAAAIIAALREGGQVADGPQTSDTGETR